MKTYKESWSDYPLDWLIWPLIKILWEPFSKKKSHWWHWKQFDSAIILHSKNVTIFGKKQAKERDTFWNMFWQTNFGWKDAVIVRPLINEGLSYYRVGYIEFHGEVSCAEICSILIPANRTVSLLIGPNKVSFFAIDANTGQQIILEIVEETTKSKLGKTLLI